MGTGHPPQNKRDRLDEFRGVEHADNVLPLREENARLRRIKSPYRESNEIIRLLEENGRLRKLAIELSNLVEICRWEAGMRLNRRWSNDCP